MRATNSIINKLKPSRAASYRLRDSGITACWSDQNPRHRKAELQRCCMRAFNWLLTLLLLVGCKDSTQPHNASQKPPTRGAPSTVGSGLWLRKSFRFVAGRRLSSAALFGLVAFAVIHSLYRGFSWSSTMLCRSFRMADAHKFQFIIAVSGVRPPTRSLAFGSPKCGGPICQTPDMERCW